MRAWLEDVRPPQRRWRDAEDTRRNFQENARTFARNLEYLKQLARRDFGDPDDHANLVGKSVSSWKDNPPMLRTFQNIAARSEILGNDDRHSVSKRSTRSMFEGSEYDRYNRGKRANGRLFQFATGDDAVNAKVRKAIENSFIKQMEENAAMESETKESVKDDRNSKSEDESAKTERSSSNTESRSSEKSRSQQSQGNPAPKRSRKSKAPCVPSLKKKELPDMINELPGAKNTAKRIMDAVIREMVDAKALDHHHARPSDRAIAIGDYEVDSLERSKCSRKSSTSPDQSSTDNQSSPALSTALPMDEELTMQNAVINTRTGEMTMSKLSNQILVEKNCYSSLPELISSQRSETYSLVSEVYVNDGYASPACSDDSGPEIQYEPENPGHLTIKVQDSPENYVKLDESEYEPDTLDRKPMKLRINDDMQYNRGEIANEIYVDSLERPAQILLKSRGSFRDDNSTTLQRGHGSLREIYEARIKSSLKDPHLTNGHDAECQMNGESDSVHSWKKCRYLTPDSRQAKRQRQPHNQPDVVPLPPTEEDIYQRPKPPRRVEDAKLPPLSPKNAWDGSPVGAGDPTASNGAPVPKIDGYYVGDQTCLCAPQTQVDVAKYEVYNEEHREDVVPLTGTVFFNGRIGECTVTNGCRDCPCETRIEIEVPEDRYRFYGHVGASKEGAPVRGTKGTREKRSTGSSYHRSSAKGSRARSWSVDHNREDEDKLLKNDRAQNCSRTRQLMKGLSKSCDSNSNVLPLVDNRRGHVKIEDSGYLSSTDSNGSHKRLLKHEVSSVSEETDETESVCDGASESGAESVGTDSVFFGNFRRLSEISKSADSGVDLGAKNPSYYQPLYGTRTETAMERANFSTSDSETESLVTVLPPCNGQCNKLVA